MLHRDWDLYDTRHVVFRPARLTPEAAGGRLLARLPRFLPLGHHRARRRHQADTRRARCATSPTPAGWKKFEPLWDWLIRARRVGRALPVLETVLEGVARWRRPGTQSGEAGVAQGGHGAGSASDGRGIRETLLALR